MKKVFIMFVLVIVSFMSFSNCVFAEGVTRLELGSGSVTSQIVQPILCIILVMLVLILLINFAVKSKINQNAQNQNQAQNQQQLYQSTEHKSYNTNNSQERNPWDEYANSQPSNTPTVQQLNDVNQKLDAMLPANYTHVSQQKTSTGMGWTIGIIACSITISFLVAFMLIALNVIKLG